MFHMTYDNWGEVNIISKFQHPSSSAWEMKVLQIISKLYLILRVKTNLWSILYAHGLYIILLGLEKLIELQLQLQLR